MNNIADKFLLVGQISQMPASAQASPVLLETSPVPWTDQAYVPFLYPSYVLRYAAHTAQTRYCPNIPIKTDSPRHCILECSCSQSDRDQQLRLGQHLFRWESPLDTPPKPLSCSLPPLSLCALKAPQHSHSPPRPSAKTITPGCCCYKTPWSPTSSQKKEGRSSNAIPRPLRALRRLPVDILRRHLDIAGLAMDATVHTTSVYVFPHQTRPKEWAIWILTHFCALI
jgi:hypothetical protein